MSVPFSYYGTNVQRLFSEITNMSELCNSSLADFIREKSYDLKNVSRNVDNYFLELLDMMHDLIHTISDRTGDLIRWQDTWIISVVVFALVLAGTLGILGADHVMIKKVVTKYFRTKHNPYNPAELSRNSDQHAANWRSS